MNLIMDRNIVKRAADQDQKCPVPYNSLMLLVELHRAAFEKLSPN